MIWCVKLLLLVVLVGADLSYDTVTMGTLPEDVAEELKYMLTSGFVDLTPNCTGSQKPETGFLLYNRINADVPIRLTPSDPYQIEPRKKVLLIVHGWLSNTTSLGITQLKGEYLKRYDANIISIDWSAVAWLRYSTAFCHVPLIGAEIADFLYLLNEKHQVRLNTIHLIGHSMGGQIVGYAGQYLKSKYNQLVGRITGLDPAGPMYKYQPESTRLDASDAEFVDVIHTDLFKLGHGPNCGAVDFHPNCALPQPGCPSVNVKDDDTLVSDALCSHHRSLDYMAESVNTENFIAVSCSLCSRYCHPDIITEVYQEMGENCREIPKPAKNFLINTNSSPPYGKGWDPYSKVLSKIYFCKNVDHSTNAFLRKICSSK